MKISNFIIELLSTFFYIGYLPLIPGTWASLVALCLFYLLKDNPLVYALLLLLLLIIGFLTSGRAEERIFFKKDARCIVIDEVVGMLISLMFIPYNIKSVIMAFIIFRILDALKPYPAGRFQNLKGSLGIMSDDIIAGLYTNIILQLVFKACLF